MKATHNGTCQVCGRQQAHDFCIAKHGYEVAGYGYFHGVCPGSGYKALELDRSRADQIAAQLRASAAAERENADLLLRGPAEPLFAWTGRQLWNKETRKHEDERLPWDAATPEQRERTIQRIVARHHRAADMNISYADEIQARAAAVTGVLELTPRQAAPVRKPIEVGSRVKAYGQERVVLAIESRMCRGCGPKLNGRTLPHAVFEGGLGIPTKLIRTVL